jgi:hypothetical protein
VHALSSNERSFTGTTLAALAALSALVSLDPVEVTR